MHNASERSSGRATRRSEWSAAISRRKLAPPAFDAVIYRGRNVVERCFNKLKNSLRHDQDS